MPLPDELNTIIANGKEAAARLTGPRAPVAKLLRNLVAEVQLGTDQGSIVLDGPVRLKRKRLSWTQSGF